MATRLKPIAHDDRLSLVEHLDELRTRIIICVVALLRRVRRLPVAGGLRPRHRQQAARGRRQQRSRATRRATRSSRPTAGSRRRRRSTSEIARDGDVARRVRGRAPSTLREQAEDLAAAARGGRRDHAEHGRRSCPVTLGVGEPLTATLIVAGYAALLITLPLLLYQAYAFVLPAFSPTERQVALPLMMMVPFLFYAGVVFAYFLVLPAAVDFLQNFNDDNYDVLLQARDYNKFAIMVLGVMGLLFQLPVLILAITRMGILTPRQLAQEPPLRDPRHRGRRRAAARAATP